MRIVGGTYGGRTLVTPEGSNVRPTTDRVREALFNILEHGETALEGARVLDLFSGSGALGLEALSRGAATILFVEVDADARGAIRENVEALGATGATRVFRRDATDLGPMPKNQGEAYDLVFLDPPYGKDLGPLALASAMEGGWLKEGATIVFECGADEKPDVSGFKLEDSRRYGDTKVLFLRVD
jgi:16S rRNA (guanine966-N2)-methyltransferase